jgi:hypothetical protein
MKNMNKLENILSNAQLDWASLMKLNIYNTSELVDFLKDKLSDEEVSEMAKAKNLSIKVEQYLDYDISYEYYIYFVDIMNDGDYITSIREKEVYPVANEYDNKFNYWWEI